MSEIENSVAMELLLREHITIDDALNDLNGFLMCVTARAHSQKYPECSEIENRFEHEISYLTARANDNKKFAEYGEIYHLNNAAEAFCNLGAAQMHGFGGHLSALFSFQRASAYIDAIKEINPSSISDSYYILCKIAYGMGIISAFSSRRDNSEIIESIDSCLDISECCDTVSVPYKKLRILKGILSDKKADTANLLEDLRFVSDILRMTDEHYFLDLLVIGKAYQKVALYQMQELKDLKAARKTITNGYYILPDKFIKNIYARDLWRFCPNHTEAGLLSGTGSGYKNDIFDYNNFGEVYANYYLAILYFNLGTGVISPDPCCYQIAYDSASLVLEKSAEKIKKGKDLLEKSKYYIEEYEKQGLIGNIEQEKIENLKKNCVKFEKELAAFDFMETVKKQSVLHFFATAECLKYTSFEFDIPLEDLDEKEFKYRILKGAFLFRKGCKTKDKNTFKKAYGLLSELEKMRFDRNDMSKFKKYEQVILADGYIALAELIGNKKCGIGNDTAKAKAILDGLNGSFTISDSRDHFGRYYSDIKKSLFGGYSFKWIAK